MDAEKTALRAELKMCQARLAQTQKRIDQLEATTKHLNFLDNAIDGYFFTNERDEVLFLNLYLLRMLGYSDIDRHALVGAPLPTLHWQDLDDLSYVAKQVREEGFVRDLKVYMNALNGTPLSVSLSAVATQDASGAFVGTQYMLRPLPQKSGRGTAELRAENRELAALTAIGHNVLSTTSLAEVVEHLMATVQKFFEVSTAWIYLRDKNGSRRLAAHEGLSDEQVRLVADAVENFFTLPRLSGERQPHRLNTRHYKTGVLISHSLGISNLTVAPLVAHEETLGLLVLGSPSERFMDENDMVSLERIAQYAGLALSNVMLYNDLQAAYEELKEAQEKLVEAERQKVVVEMAGAAAHELNQPLTVLLGYSNLLARMRQENDPQREIFEKIERATRKISEVVEKLGQITRYRTRPYLEGHPIVDIEAAATSVDET